MKIIFKNFFVLRLVGKPELSKNTIRVLAVPFQIEIAALLQLIVSVERISIPIME